MSDDFALLHNDTMWVFDEVQLFGEALATSAQLEGLRRSMPNGVGPTTSLWMSATVEPGWLHTDGCHGWPTIQSGCAELRVGLGSLVST